MNPHPDFIPDGMMDPGGVGWLNHCFGLRRDDEFSGL